MRFFKLKNGIHTVDLVRKYPRYFIDSINKEYFRRYVLKIKKLHIPLYQRKFTWEENTHGSPY